MIYYLAGLAAIAAGVWIVKGELIDKMAAYGVSKVERDGLIWMAVLGCLTAAGGGYAIGTEEEKSKVLESNRTHCKEVRQSVYLCNYEMDFLNEPAERPAGRWQ